MPFTDRLHQHLLAADADALADLYTPDAEMLSFEFGSKAGRDAIREQYERFLAFHGAVASAEVTRQTESGDRMFFELEMESERGRFVLVHAVILEGEHAAVHFTNVIEGEVEADEAGASGGTQESGKTRAPGESEEPGSEGLVV
jgi:hypothetical protein